MRVVWIYLWSLLAISLPIAGCSYPDSQPANQSLPPENGIGERAERALAGGQKSRSILIKAKYFEERAPCIKRGNGWVMPIADAFEVIQVVRGSLKPKEILIRQDSDRSQAYPRNLKIGRIYFLKLTPSRDTLEQLKERKKDGYSWIWVDGNELEQQAEKLH